MTVSQLLRSLSAHEVAEWKAFERAYGPLGRDYGNEKLAEIHETLQQLISVQATNYEPKRSTRPHEVWDEQEKAGD